MFGPFLSALAKFNGNIPNAAGGLLGAAIAESRAMPRGSNLVVANDSEYILRPDQMQRLIAGTAGRGGASSINFSPTFNIQGVTDPTTIAQQTLDLLDSMLQDYVGGQLA